MKPGPAPKPIADRFWPKVDKNGPIVRTELGPCWIWTGALREKGYGQLMVRAIGRPMIATRVAWFLAHETWPSEDQQVCHRCDNPPCVNADHLFLGSNDDNVRDVCEKGRQVRGTKSPWAKLTEDNVDTIRRLCDAGMTQAKVSGLFRINQALVSRIVNRRRWAEGAPQC